MSKTIVRFRRQWDKYNGGERAGFAPHVAEALCSGEDPVAELVEPATVEAPAKAVVTDTSRASAKKAATKRKTKKG